MDSPRDVKDLMPLEGMERREFLQKVLSAAVGLPAAGMLLSGCGGGILDSSDDAGPAPPQGNLSEEVQQMRDAISGVMQAVRSLQEAGDADLTGWLAQINTQLAVVWPLMVAAGQQDLRANVSDEMQQVLDQLDQFGSPLTYSGAAPQITQQQLQDAWERADALMLAQPTAEEAYATPNTWIFFLMLFLVFPAIAPGDAFNYAQAASSMDTDSQAGVLYSLLHPLGSISCTPCFFGAVLSGVLGSIMLLFMAMGPHAATAPSMLFGRDWMIMLVLLATLYVLFLSSE